MSRGVLDASALLALLNQERGSERIAAIIADKATISTVNFSEVVAKLSNDRKSPPQATPFQWLW
jgi:PIN domain nuclease of toxin-antitoxin system